MLRRVKAWWFWSLTHPSLHQATCQFADEASPDRAMKGEDLKRLVADFNRDWPDVTRMRDVRAGRGVCGVAVANSAVTLSRKGRGWTESAAQRCLHEIFVSFGLNQQGSVSVHLMAAKLLRVNPFHERTNP
jgi:hypothetical protein